MPLFRRSDGDLVKEVDAVRRMMPYIMRGRNESIVYHTTQWDVTGARVWLRAFNRARATKAQATLFHLAAYAIVKTFYARPGLNRFVSGGRIYQRRGMWISFAIKTTLADGAPLRTVKLYFPENETFDEYIDRIAEAVKTGRSEKESRIESEVRLLTKLPGPVLQILLAAARGLDRLNLLPAALLTPDPMYASIFMANLGSIHIDNAYHHLYEYGTCSFFCVLSDAKPTVVTDRSGRSQVRLILQPYWSFDERINDGFYCMKSLEFMRRFIEDPERYVEVDVASAPVNSEASEPAEAVTQH